MFEAEFWVAVAFVMFVGVLIYFGVHRAAVSAIDARRTRIQADLDEARRLREEAQSLLEQYQGKQRQAEREAAGIIAEAEAEAERIAAEAKAKMEDLLARRTKL